MSPKFQILSICSTVPIPALALGLIRMSGSANEEIQQSRVSRKAPPFYCIAKPYIAVVPIAHI